MNKNYWLSERLNQHINLCKLSKEELIAEIFFERKNYLDFEDEIGEL